MGHDFKRFPELTNSQMEFYYLESPHKQITEDFSARVVRVIDGDTIILDWQERNFNFPVRFLNINAPEMSEGGEESRKWLETQVLGLEVDVKIDIKQRVGKYGRLLGTIFADGINILNESLSLEFSRPFGTEVSPFPSINKELRRAEF